MAKKTADVIERPEPIPFTGVARSVECHNTNGMFRNFKIVTLSIENGIVTDIKKSDPYASFESISFLELWNQQSVIDLNEHWEDGKAFLK